MLVVKSVNQVVDATTDLKCHEPLEPFVQLDLFADVSLFCRDAMKQTLSPIVRN